MALSIVSSTYKSLQLSNSQSRLISSAYKHTHAKKQSTHARRQHQRDREPFVRADDACRLFPFSQRHYKIAWVGKRQMYSWLCSCNVNISPRYRVLFVLDSVGWSPNNLHRCRWLFDRSGFYNSVCQLRVIRKNVIDIS